MAFVPEMRRSTIIPLAGLAVAAYYLLVLLPLARRSHHLDAPLQSGWQKLAASLEQTNAPMTSLAPELAQAQRMYDNLTKVLSARKNNFGLLTSLIR